MLQKLKGNYFLLILSVFFILIFTTNMQIGLFGDDYYYASFSKLGFWKTQVDHYMQSNGRALVHFLVSVFLKLPRFCWALFNTICIVGIGFFQSKINAFLINSKKAFRKSFLIYMISFLALDILVVRQSVFWVTGSLNYVFPTFMMFWYWYTLIKAYKTNYDKSYFLKVCILGFLASATVEQTAMMTFGLTFLLLVHSLYCNHKNKNKQSILPIGIILFCSLLGMLSVMLAPSQFIRMGIDHGEDYVFSKAVVEYTKFLISRFVVNRYYKIPVIIAIISTILFFITKKKREKLSSDLIYLIYTTIIIGAGSQVMLVVSTVYGERTTLVGAYMIIFYASILNVLLPDWKKKSLDTIICALYAFLLCFAVFHQIQTTIKYHKTDEIQKQNIAIIDDYKQNTKTGSISLYKFPDDAYGWSMPYISKYHEHWFEFYYDIPDTEIVWLDA